MLFCPTSQKETTQAWSATEKTYLALILEVAQKDLVFDSFILCCKTGVVVMYYSRNVFCRRINELSILNERLKLELAEKDKTIGTLQRNVSSLEARRIPNGTAGAHADIIEQVSGAL